MNDDEEPFKCLQKDFKKLHELDNQKNLKKSLTRILKWSYLLLFEVIMISLPKLSQGRMQRVKMTKMITIWMKVRQQRVLQQMKSEIRLKRCKISLFSVHMRANFAVFY